MTTLERLRRRILLPIGFGSLFTAVIGAAADIAVLFRASAVAVALVLAGMLVMVAMERRAEASGRRADEVPA